MHTKQYQTLFEGPGFDSISAVSKSIRSQRTASLPKNGTQLGDLVVWPNFERSSVETGMASVFGAKTIPF